MHSMKVRKRLVSHRLSFVADSNSAESLDGTANHTDTSESQSTIDYDKSNNNNIPNCSYYDMHQTREAFELGVEIEQRKIHKRQLKYNAFAGSAAIDFLIDSGYAPNRQQALHIGRLLAYEFALFNHETNDYDLEDAKDLYYVFTNPEQRIIVPAYFHDSSHSLSAIADVFEEIVVIDATNTFVGRDAVSFLTLSQIAKTRQDAVRIGQLLMDKGLFRHVDREHRFKDKDLLYRFIPKRQHIMQDCHHNNSSCSIDLIPIEETAQRFRAVIPPGNAFSGSSAIDTMIEAGVAISRSQAVQLGHHLCVDLGLFVCIQDNTRAFMDRKDVYYNYIEEVYERSKSLNWVDNNNDTSGNLEDYVQDLSLVMARKGSTKLEQSNDSMDTSDKSQPRIDRFGFILLDDDETSVDCSFTEKELSIGEWRRLLKNCTLSDDSPPDESPTISRNTIKRGMRTGLPDCMRRQAWTTITGVSAVIRHREGDYKSLVRTATRLLEKEQHYKAIQGVIQRDLRRTFPHHCLFYQPSENSAADNSQAVTPDGLLSLRRVLYAYSLYDNEVGYCQGMNFIAAMFLTFLSEEEAFWLLVAVMREEPYYMRDLFAEDMAGVHEALHVADKVIEKFLPRLHTHFANENIHISMYATQWLMTVFTSTFPFDLVSVVWDSFIVEGWKPVYRVMLALLELAEPKLLQLDMEGILSHMRDDISKVEGPAIMKASLKIPLRQKHLRKYASEYRSSKTLKRKNSKLGSKIGKGVRKKISGLSRR